MNKILLFGGGRSAGSLIDYLLTNADLKHCTLTIVDQDIEAVRKKIGDHTQGHAIRLDIQDETSRQQLIRENDVVISMLPVHLHHLIIDDCLQIGRHLCTASYVTEDMASKAARAAEHGIIFMGELGLDPGLDHMSAMKCIEDIRAQGGKLNSFHSHVGGLVAPESDTNPWHYKISWNPRNVVLAGQGMATYRHDGQIKYVPYHKLFKRTEVIEVPGSGSFDMYFNRDSLKYLDIYQVDEVQSLVRGTLRHPGYCQAWSVLVELGLTDDTTKLSNLDQLTLREWTNTFIPFGNGSVSDRLAQYIGIARDSEIMEQLAYLGLFSEQPVPIIEGTAAQVVESLIKDKWRMHEEDKDMVVMQHEFLYEIDGHHYEMKSGLTYIGNNASDTAMSRLVGWPLGIYVKLLMTGRIHHVRIVRPVEPQIYLPILEELGELGVEFHHEVHEVSVPV